MNGNLNSSDIDSFLDDSGLEMKIHYEFCDNLIKFGVEKKYVDQFRDSFDIEKVDILDVTQRDIEIKKEVDELMRIVEQEEIHMKLEEGVDEFGNVLTEEQLSHLESLLINQAIPETVDIKDKKDK